MQHPPPLLVTSAVRPSDPTVVLSNHDQRIRYTLDALSEWLRMHPTLQIVICDGSGYDFSPVLVQMFPNHRIEALHFQNSSALVRQLGKGYGEGEIVKYALQHSNLLASSTFFAKCTSKLWVNNFDACVRHWNGTMLFQAKISNVLKNSPLVFRHIDTRFYLMDRSRYETTFMNAHQKVNDAADQSLEHCFMDAIELGKFIKYHFPVYPQIEGYSGTTGGYFNDSFWEILAERVKIEVLNMRTSVVSEWRSE